MRFPSFRCTAYNNEFRKWSDLRVQATISDKRRSVCNEELGIAYFEAEVLTQTDYYPFGATMPDRQWSAGAEGHRYGFNGMERDDEVKGDGNSIAYELRIYDSRIGRFTLIDPREKEYPWPATYAYFSNSPIRIVDFRGGGPVEKDEAEDASKTANPEPKNKVQKIWWNLRLSIAKVAGNTSIGVNSKDVATGKVYRKRYCVKDCEPEGGNSGGGGVGGGSTNPNSLGVPAVTPGAVTVPGAVPPVGGGTVLVNLNENAFPGSTPGLLTGTATPLNTNFVIPPAPAGITTGTIWITYGTNLAVVGAPGGSDGITDDFQIRNLVGGRPVGIPLLNTGQILVGNQAAAPIAVTPDQQFVLTVTPSPTAVTSGAVTDRFYIVVRVTFP